MTSGQEGYQGYQGAQLVEVGGTAISTTTNDGGLQQVFSGAIATDTTKSTAAFSRSTVRPRDRLHGSRLGRCQRLGEHGVEQAATNVVGVGKSASNRSHSAALIAAGCTLCVGRTDVRGERRGGLPDQSQRRLRDNDGLGREDTAKTRCCKPHVFSLASCTAVIR
jgi:autotransporter passenger strand-loop-strand repeat protein